MSFDPRRDRPICALPVDDEEPAVAELRFRLEELGEPLELETARTSVEALRLRHQRP